MLGQSFAANIPATGPSSQAQQLTANQITAALVAQFLATEQGHLSGPYVLVWTDPIDFILTDANARQNGYTAARGPISETGGSFNSGAGALKLVIVPFTSASYDLDLVGVGEGPVLFGAALITDTGGSVDAVGSPDSALPIALASMTDLVVVLGFNNPETSGASISPAADPPAADPAVSPSATQTQPALSPAATGTFTVSTSLLLSTNPLSGPAAAFFAAAGGGRDTISIGVEGIALSPANVTTLLAAGSNSLATLDQSHDAPVPVMLPNPAGQAQGAPGHQLVSGHDRRRHARAWSLECRRSSRC